MFYNLTLSSKNRKLGPIAVATISKESCPITCPLKMHGCYAEGGPLAIIWSQVTKGTKGVRFPEFLRQVKKLPRDQMWRYGQAGDLPGHGDAVDRTQLLALARANAGRPVICFTHKRDFPALREAQDLGFTITLSANSIDEVDMLADQGLPVAVVLPSEYGKTSSEDLATYRDRVRRFPRHTAAGRRIAVCPATYTDTTCSQCRVCSRQDRKGVVIGFPAHGSRRKLIDRRLVTGDV